MFPDEQMLGVDVVIPDITYLRALGERFRGDLPHPRPRGPHRRAALRARGARRAGVRHAADARLRARAAARARPVGDARAPTERCAHRIGPFTVESFAMTHSIPDAVGLAIRTPVGTVVHTGDFKLDQTPLDGRPAGPRRGSPSSAPRACSSCSPTRPTSSSPGVTPSERTVGGAARRHLPAGDRPRAGHDVLVAHPPHAAGGRLRRRASAGAWRSSAGASSRTSAWRASWGCCTCPRRTLVDLGAARDLPRGRGDAASPPAARRRPPRRSCASPWTRTSR